MLKTDYERIDVPIDCSRCHGIFTYSMLRMYSDIRQTCKYGDVCNTCLKPNELKDLVLILGCEESTIINNDRPGDCDNLIEQK